MNRIVVVGAGIGGLTTAALLAKAGLDVTVLEAHVYPGGSRERSTTRGIDSTPGRPWPQGLSRAAG